MTEKEIHEAIAQMRSACRLREQSHYEVISARGLLYELGYSEDQAREVLQHMYNGGFTYCLDHQFYTCSYPDFKPELPSQDVCYWGPDQLRSRIDSLSNWPRWEYLK